MIEWLCHDDDDDDDDDNWCADGHDIKKCVPRFISAQQHTKSSTDWCPLSRYQRDLLLSIVSVEIMYYTVLQLHTHTADILYFHNVKGDMQRFFWLLK